MVVDRESVDRRKRRLLLLMLLLVLVLLLLLLVLLVLVLMREDGKLMVGRSVGVRRRSDSTGSARGGRKSFRGIRRLGLLLDRLHHSDERVGVLHRHSTEVGYQMGTLLVAGDGALCEEGRRGRGGERRRRGQLTFKEANSSDDFDATELTSALPRNFSTERKEETTVAAPVRRDVGVGFESMRDVVVDLVLVVLLSFEGK